MWPRPLAPRPHSVMLLHELPVAYKASAEQKRSNEAGYARDPEVSCPEPDLPSERLGCGQLGLLTSILYCTSLQDAVSVLLYCQRTYSWFDLTVLLCRYFGGEER